MSLVPCFACVADEGKLRAEIRKAEQARAQDRPLAAVLLRVAALKDNLAACEHASMENGRDASRARHAAARSAS